MTHEGSLLAFSGFGDRDSVITSIIAANLWNTYQKNGSTSLKDDQLQLVLMDCTVKIIKIYNMVPIVLLVNVKINYTLKLKIMCTCFY